MKPALSITIGIIIIFILLSLIIGVYVNGKDLSCNKCSVEFTNTKVSGARGNFLPIAFEVINLYNNLKLNNTCLVKWDKNRGYYG